MKALITLTFAIVLLFPISAICAKKQPARLAPAAFASEAVMRELYETRPALTALSLREQATLHLWLLANCAVGAEERRTELVSLSARVEPALIEAFRMGPPTASLNELSSHRRADFVSIQERLTGEDAELFTAEVRTLVAKISEPAYVLEGVNQAILDYRLAALLGIAQIGSRTSVAWLERTIPTLPDSELSRAAALTLSALRARQRR